MLLSITYYLLLLIGLVSLFNDICIYVQLFRLETKNNSYFENLIQTKSFIKSSYFITGKTVIIEFHRNYWENLFS